MRAGADHPVAPRDDDHTLQRQSVDRESYQTARTIPSVPVASDGCWVMASGARANAAGEANVAPPSVDRLQRKSGFTPEDCSVFASQAATSEPSPANASVGCRSASVGEALASAGWDHWPPGLRRATKISQLSGSVPVPPRWPVHNGSTSRRSSDQASASRPAGATANAGNSDAG